MKRVIFAAAVAALSFVGFADDEVVCYVNAGGSATAPYDTREKGAKSIYDCWQLDPKPTKIIICAGTTSGGNGYNNRAEITAPLVIEGENKQTSAIDERIWLKHEGAVMRNLTFLSQKWEGGGDTPSLFLTGAMLTNVIVRNVNPYRYNPNGNGNGAINAYSGARIIDCEIINNNINPTTGKQLCSDGTGCSAIQIGNLQRPNDANFKGGGVIVDHCIITNNMGGRVRAAAIVVANNYTPTPIVRNSLIAHNHMLNRTIPGVGAGIYAKGGLIVENCTIVSNDIAGAGAGVYAAANGLVISNSVVAFNVGVGEATTNEIAAADGVTATWTNCLVPEGAEVTGEGLVRGDPLFNRDANPNFPYWWLTAGSPAVDKGATADWMPGATDLAGEARVVGAAVDIGAYEFDISLTDPLVVTGEPGEYATVEPTYGSHVHLTNGRQIPCAAPGGVVPSGEGDGVSYTCAGYVVYTNRTGESDVWLERERGETTSYTHVHVTGRSEKLVWLWKRIYDVTATAGEHGSIDMASQSVAEGGTATITATPDAGYAVAWTGDVDNSLMFDNPLVLDDLDGSKSLTATFFVPSSNEGAKTGLFADYSHSTPVRFPGYDGAEPLADFPVLVRLKDGMGGFAYADCSFEDGLDVRFCDAAGVELASEVVKWNAIGTSEFWVKVPQLANDARIFLVWGNPDATARPPRLRVWGENFRGVWGLDAGRNVSPDKSPSGQHATFHEAAVPLVQEGVVGEARHFTGTVGAGAAFEEDSIALVGNTDIDALQPATFTVSCWFRAAAYPAASAYATFMAGTARYDDGMWPNCFIGLDSSGHVIGCDRLAWGAPCLNTSYITTSDRTVPLGEWHHFAYSLEADGKTRVYLDGALVGTRTQSRTFDAYWGKSWEAYRIPSFGMMRNFGDRVYSAARKRVNPFVGDLDEVRLTDGVRGDDWVRTEYLMIASNDTFVAVGAGGSLTVDGVPQPLARQIEASATNSEQDGVKKTCLGYSVVADGKTVASGVESSVSLAWPKNAQNVAVKWNWKTEYAVTVNGAVTWVEADSVFTVEAPAAPDEAQFFHSWDGDVPKFETFSPTFELGVTKPMALTATFAPVTNVTAEMSANDIDALKNAINAVGKSPTPVVVLVGDGVYTMDAPSRAYLCAMTAPIVIRSVNGSAKTMITNTIELGMFDTGSSGNKSAIIGFTLRSSALSADNICEFGKFKNTSFRDCVFQTMAPPSKYTISLDMNGGWMSQCTICNGVNAGYNGYGALVTLADVTLDSCVVSNNCQKVTPISISNKSRISNTLFANNVAKSGSGFNGGAAGLADNNEDTVFENCTFVGNRNNSSTTGGKYGGALYSKLPVAVVNTAFANNSNAFASDGNDFYGPIAFVHSMSVDMPEGALGSLKSAPAFKDGENPLYLPRATSASIDAGFATVAAADPAAKDLVGTNRVEGVAVDIGAVEFHSSPDDPFDVNVTPSAILGRDTLSVSFAVTLAGNQGPVTYSWDFGDGTTSTEARPTHVYSSSGTFTVTLTVSDTKTGKTASWTSGEQPITVLPSVCYINAEGSSTYPYDTREKGAKSIADCCPIGPDKIVVCANTKADGDYVEVKTPLVIEGEDKYTSIVDERIWLQHKDAIMRNLTFKSTKYESNGDTPSLFVSYGMLTNIIVRNTDPHGYNGNEGDGAVNAYLGARIIDCEIVNNNMNENGARYRSGTGVAAIQIGNHHRPTEAIRDGGGVIIDHCIITNNMGGRYYGAAILVANNYSPAPIVRNSLIAHNHMKDRTVAGVGAGIYALGALIVENCTIVSNDIAGAGAGVYAAAAGLEVRNSIVACNVGAGEATTNEIASATGVTATWANCCVPEGAEVSGEGLVRGDPKFNLGARKSKPYWSLRGNSPCKDAGVKLDWMEGAIDLIGNPRAYGGKPDMGCYENLSGGLSIIVR